MFSIWATRCSTRKFPSLAKPEALSAAWATSLALFAPSSIEAAISAIAEAVAVAPCQKARKIYRL